MKKIILVLFISFCFFTLRAQETATETAIKKVIEGETLAFANADLAAWSDYFVHESYLRWAVSAPNDPTHVMSFDGWDALYNGAKSFLSSQSGHKDADALHKITRSAWVIHINGDVAWVKFIQVTEGEAIAAHQFRVLEKKDGKWKISMLCALH